MSNNPMNGCVFPYAKQCKAKSKRSKVQCRNPAVRGWNVCRHHGAGGGAPTGKANGAYRHGAKTNEAISERRKASEIMKASRVLMADVMER